MIVYVLRYKGCVYITIILVGTSQLVRYSREFAITVFVLTIIFFLSFCRVFAVESKLLRYKHEFLVCVFVVFVLYCIKMINPSYICSRIIGPAFLVKLWLFWESLEM